MKKLFSCIPPVILFGLYKIYYTKSSEESPVLKKLQVSDFPDIAPAYMSDMEKAGRRLRDPMVYHHKIIYDSTVSKIGYQCLYCIYLLIT